MKLVQIYFKKNLIDLLILPIPSFFLFLLEHFSLLDPDPHIECESGSRRQYECGSMRIRIHSPDDIWWYKMIDRYLYCMYDDILYDDILVWWYMMIDYDICNMYDVNIWWLIYVWWYTYSYGMMIYETVYLQAPASIKIGILRKLILGFFHLYSMIKIPVLFCLYF